MAKRVIKTNPNLIGLIGNLKEKSYKEEVAIWKDVAKRLERSTRRQAEVNISTINRFSQEAETVLIPGKVLSNGSLDHKVSVVALNFSQNAQEKIEEAGGECISISDILDKNPKGNNIRILE
ncbi:50S ribosomal protein L15 [Methanobrevibacter cuticularis]|uniref:Large ribosomal subunit protein eL18 n=1 Tax=Methanobrevibacter cuticularis TaxID=47311 RepID=A0A166FJM1_9EURY|nr:50S ribosomal protein L18e [Methanobrevibacter cuticularis]KZX17744.1 50S ribosomal protein L15 [Methanobrevibacter cuticularis]